MTNKVKISNVAILTLYYHNANYGALLQSYALQRKLEKLGYNSKQISYKLETGYKSKNWLEEQIKKVKRTLSFIKPYYHRIKYGGWGKGRLQMEKRLISFAESIPHSIVVTSVSIGELVPEFNAFICGSDQIWNPSGWQPTLFLDFVKKANYDNLPLKLSYAASIARDMLTEEELDIIKKYTADFDAVSVREINLIPTLSDYLNRDVVVVPDPCFLLRKNEWTKLIAPDVDYGEEYIFVYYLGNSIERREEILEFAKMQNLNVYFTPYMNKNSEVRKWEKNHADCMFKETIGVLEFLDLIYHAKLVIADSFHAIVFSIIFNTPFYVFGRNLGKNNTSSMNSRLTSLLSEFNLEDKLIETLPANPYIFSQNEVDIMNIKLNELLIIGERFLTESLAVSNSMQ